MLVRLIESLGQLRAQADKAQQSVFKKEIEIVLKTARKAIDQEEDLASLEERAKLALQETPASARA